jgi:hypothetical protein
MPASRPGAARFALRRCLCAVLTLAAACGGGGTDTKETPPPPAITGMDPAVALQYDEDFFLTVTGSGFTEGAVVRWNGSPRPTHYASPSQIAAEITNADLQQPGPVQVTVSVPGQAASNQVQLMVQSRVPAVLFTTPERVVRATGAFTLRVFGDGFSQGSVVRWNGAAKPTTFVHPGELTAQIANADIQQAGAVQVTVFTPAPGGGASNVHAFPVDVPPNPAAVVTGMSPSTVVAGTGGTITVTGNWFFPGVTRVAVTGMATEPAVTVVSLTELRFTLTPGNMPPAGQSQVSVFNPAPGGGGALVPGGLRVDDPKPVLTSLSPAQAVVGQASQVVRIIGTGFVPDSYIRFDDVGRGTGYVSPTELQLVLGANDLDQAGTFPVTVTNFGSGGGLSNTLTFTVTAPAPAPSRAPGDR